MRTLILAGQGLRGTWLRSLLTIIALTLGMLGFVVVISSDIVVREAITQRAVLSSGPATTIRLTFPETTTLDVAERQRQQLQRRTGAAHSALTIEDPETSVWLNDQLYAEATIEFVSPELREIRGFPVDSGSWLGSGEAIAPRIVVNRVAAADLTNPNSVIEFGSHEMRQRAVVAGVIYDGRSAPHLYAAIDAYIPVASSTAAPHLDLHAPGLQQSHVSRAVDQLRALGTDIEAAEIRRIDTVDEYAGELTTTRQVLVVLGILSLVSTAVGIINVGLATARSRAKEFTLRRTVGASKSQIMLIVMLESQILAVGAAIIAFVGAALFHPFIAGSLGIELGIETPPFDARTIIVCLIVASATAAISSLVPALLSYRRDISTIMRE